MRQYSDNFCSLLVEYQQEASIQHPEVSNRGDCWQNEEGAEPGRKKEVVPHPHHSLSCCETKFPLSAAFFFFFKPLAALYAALCLKPCAQLCGCWDFQGAVSHCIGVLWLQSIPQPWVGSRKVPAHPQGDLEAVCPIGSLSLLHMMPNPRGAAEAWSHHPPDAGATPAGSKGSPQLPTHGETPL